MKTERHTDNLQREIDTLPREITLARDLWPGIEHALEDKATKDPRRPYLLAASIAMLTFLLGWYLRPLEPEAEPPVSHEELLNALRQTHEANKQGLLSSYQASTVFYPGWQKEMQQLEEAEASIYEAMEASPDNLALLKLLRQVQSRQLELIDAVHAPQMTSL